MVMPKRQSQTYVNLNYACYGLLRCVLYSARKVTHCTSRFSQAQTTGCGPAARQPGSSLGAVVIESASHVAYHRTLRQLSQRLLPLPTTIPLVHHKLPPRSN